MGTKYKVQNTKFKIQSSISYTPEGTHAARSRLIVAVRIAIKKVHEASVSSIVLSTTPVESGGERVPKGSTRVSWVLELGDCRYKPGIGISAGSGGGNCIVSKSPGS
jgi:hypothetical protein